MVCCLGYLFGKYTEKVLVESENECKLFTLQNSLPNFKDGQSDDHKGQKQTKRGSIQTSMKNKEIMSVKSNLLPFPKISIVSPQGEETTASLDKEDEENGFEQEKSGETKDSREYSSETFIEEGDRHSGESSVNLSDKDSDEGSVTDDQKRALLELERQQEEIANSGDSYCLN